MDGELPDIPDPIDRAEPRRVNIPYVPRIHFRPLHASIKRFQFVCAHRRAGKTVAEYNHLLRASLKLRRKDPPPRYAYVGPSFDQTKDLVWGYAKHYAEPIPNVRFYEGDLMTVLPNGASIRLYGGSAAYERMRGVYFDGIVLDEYPLLNPAVFSSVVRPCLADYRGFGIISGTSNGDDHFHALLKKNQDNPDWDIHIIPVTSTDALSPSEVQQMQIDMSPEEYAREMLCSFEAPIEGSYYAETLNMMMAEGRIDRVSWDLNAPVITAWDLGIHDAMCIWFYQICGREIHVIDYYQSYGQPLSHYAGVINSKKVGSSGSIRFQYKAHCLPHDVEARELATGQSRRQVLSELLDEPVITAPLASPEDGIAAVRGILGMSWFNKNTTEKGMSGLRAYKRSRLGRPVHDWASHPADAFRTLATSFHLVAGYAGSARHQGPLRRRIRGIV